MRKNICRDLSRTMLSNKNRYMVVCIDDDDDDLSKGKIYEEIDGINN